jgi:hypothetical protein
MKNSGVGGNNDKDSPSGGEWKQHCVQQSYKAQFKETNLFFVSPDTRFLYSDCIH